MKFCQRCGKEIMDEAVICPGCGCAVAKGIEKAEISYEKCVKGAVTTDILSVVVIALGIICWLLINMWVGVILCLAAEFIALSPDSNLQRAFKQNGLNRKSKEDKEKMRTIKRNLKSENPAYKFSTVLAVIAVVLVVVFALSI